MRLIAEAPEGDLGKLAGLEVEAGIAGEARDLIEGVHPARQIMEVLPVTVPFQTVVEGLAGSAFGKLLADAQAACGRMRRRGAVEPAAAGIILAMPAQRLMDELDEAEGQARVTVVPGPARDRKQVADRERVRPQVALAAFALREPDHQPGRLLQAFSVRRLHYIRRIKSNRLEGQIRRGRAPCAARPARSRAVSPERCRHRGGARATAPGVARPTGTSPRKGQRTWRA